MNNNQEREKEKKDRRIEKEVNNAFNDEYHVTSHNIYKQRYQSNYNI